MKEITGELKWHFYEKSYVIKPESQDKSIRLNDLLKEFNNKKVRVTIQEL
ncbi:MAG: hypothetical protein ACFE96_18040 [Candidatus Hermodarchaeota archaeon]